MARKFRICRGFEMNDYYYLPWTAMQHEKNLNEPMWVLATGSLFAKMKIIGLNNHTIGRWSGQTSFQNQGN